MSDPTGSPDPASDGPGEPSTSPPPADAPAPDPVDETAAEASHDADEAGQAGQAGEAQPVAVPGEQIEWQPVSTGDAIAWQPVVSSSEGGSGPEWQEPDLGTPPDDPGGWDPTGAEAGAGVAAAAAGAATASANGAAGAGYDPDPPAPREPAGARSVAARRRAQAAASRPPTSGGGDGPPPVDKTRRQVVLLSALTVGVVLIGVLAFVLSRGALDEGEEAEGGTPPTTSTRTAPTIADADLQGYRDDVVGFSLRYPKAWPKLVPAVGDIRLVVQAGDNDGFSVRVLPIQTEATEQNIENFKAVTDAVVFGDQRNKLLQEQLVRVNNRLAYYYLYTFEDEVTRNQGVHAHYFIFEGLRIFSIVFQSVPSDDFTRQAGIWDQIAESFLAEQPRPGATTTTPPTTAG